MNNVVPIKVKSKSEAKILIKKCCDIYGLTGDEREKVFSDLNQIMNEIYAGGTGVFSDWSLNMSNNKNNVFGKSIKNTHRSAKTLYRKTTLSVSRLMNCQLHEESVLLPGIKHFLSLCRVLKTL